MSSNRPFEEQVSDPSTPAASLAQIAAERRDLWTWVAAHPNAYPGLLDWMRQQGFVSDQHAPVMPSPHTPAPPASAPQHLVQPFSTQATQAYTHQPVPGQPTQGGTPGFEGVPGSQPFGYGSAQAAPKKKRTGLIVGSLIGALVLIAAAIVLPLTLSGGGGGVLTKSLKNFESSDGDFSVQALDAQKLEAATGEELPEFDDYSRIESEDLPKAYRNLGILDPITLLLLNTTGGFASFYDSVGNDYVVTASRRLSSDEFEKNITSKVEDLEDGADLLTKQVDGITYLSNDLSALPEKRPVRDKSLASDDSIARTAKALEASNGYLLVIGRNDYAREGYEHNTGERISKFDTSGYALGMRDDRTVITLVYDLRTSDKAQEHSGDIENALTTSAEYMGIDAPDQVRAQGSLVIAEFEIDDDDESNRIASGLQTFYNGS